MERARAISILSRTTPVAFSGLDGALAQVERRFVEASEFEHHIDATLFAAAAAQWIVSDFANLSPLSVWAERLSANQPTWDDLDLNETLMYSAGALATHLFGDARALPDAHECAKIYRTCLFQIGSADHANVVVSTAEHVASWMTNSGQSAAFDELCTAIEPFLDNPHLDARVRVRWLFWLGTNQMYTDRREEAERSWQRALEDETAAMWPWIRFHLLRVTVRLLIEDGRYAEAAARLDELRNLVDFSRPLDLGDYHHLRGWVALTANDARVARQHYELACEAASRGSLPVPHMAIYQSGLAQSLVSEGREDEAEGLIERQPVLAGPFALAARSANLALIRACRSRRLGLDDYQKWLALGLRIACEQGLVRFFRLARPIAAALCADALTAGIEPDFVKRAILERKLPPPSLRHAHWPWPIRLQVLGSFALTLGDQAADLTQRTPLDLLRAIVAAGPLPRDTNALAFDVWPDSEGDKARMSFDTTLHRLRKMLGREDMLTLQDGRVGLNRAKIWVDAWAFKDLVEAIERGAHENPHDSLFNYTDLADELLALYRGDFLGGGQRAPWAVAAGERFKSEFARAVRLLATALSRQGNHVVAERLYRQAIERDALAEILYCELMESLMSQHRFAEALQVFRRCREMLSILLSIPPSNTTIALAARASAAAQLPP